MELITHKTTVNKLQTIKYRILPLSVLNKQAKDENTNNIPKSAKSGFMFVIL